MSEPAKEIFCCGCGAKVAPRLTDGRECYPHRTDLHGLPFWKCDDCGNFVGCHHKTKDRTRPLGCIPTPEMKKARQHIHKILDPLWQSGRMNRNDIYAKLAKVIGRKRYHTANLRTLDEARLIYCAVKKLADPKAEAHP